MRGKPKNECTLGIDRKSSAIRARGCPDCYCPVQYVIGSEDVTTIAELSQSTKGTMSILAVSSWILAKYLLHAAGLSWRKLLTQEIESIDTHLGLTIACC